MRDVRGKMGMALKRFLLRAVIASVLSGALALPAAAQEDEGSEWVFTAAPYIWLIRLKGEGTMPPPARSAEANFFSKSKRCKRAN